MRWYLVVIFSYVLAVIQTALFTPNLLGLNAFGEPVQPDLLLLMAVFVALWADPPVVFIAGWCLGLVSDVTMNIGEGPLGVTALLFGLTAWLVSLVRGLLIPTRILTQVLLVLAAVFVVRMPQQIMLFWLTGTHFDGLRALQRGCGDALYSAVLAPYLMWLFARTVARPGISVR